MFLDLFPDYLIGFVHDQHPEHKRCKEFLEFSEPLINRAKDSLYGVFFTPNGHGRTRNPKGTLYRWDGNVTKLNACFADFDTGSKEKQLETIRGFSLKPSIIVESKRGYHCYWLLRDVETTKDTISLWRRIQTTIAEKYGADKACSNPSRLMRLPGSWHIKGEPYLVTVLEASNLTYTLAEIELAFPPKPRTIYAPCASRWTKRIEMPPIMALREGERHPTLKKEAARLFANSSPSDNFAIRSALKTWYSISCINLKDTWEHEVDHLCDWLEKREFDT